MALNYDIGSRAIKIPLSQVRKLRDAGYVDSCNNLYIVDGEPILYSNFGGKTYPVYANESFPDWSYEQIDQVWRRNQICGVRKCIVGRGRYSMLAEPTNISLKPHWPGLPHKPIKISPSPTECYVIMRGHSGWVFKDGVWRYNPGFWF